MCEIDEIMTLGMKLDAWMSSAGLRTALGAERYVITPMSARKDPSGIAIQVYGIARWAALKYGAHVFVMGQTSSDALSLCTDDWLRAIGWYKIGMPHANDAARHVIKYLVDRNALPAVLMEKLGTLLTQEG
jgi:hypothetical protein